MPLAKDPKGGGTEENGKKSSKYCSFCYLQGSFTQPEINVVEMRHFVKGKLREMGYYYQCTKRRWRSNPFKFYGKRTYDFEKELQKCSSEELDESFPRAIDAMAQLRNLGREYYRYIDYDNHSFGTHEKLFSWFPMNHGQDP